MTREVLGLKSYADAETRIGGLEEAQWTVQLADNELWAANRDDNVIIDSTVKIDPGSLLGRIRNRSRLRFGLPALSGNASDAETENGIDQIQSLAWY